MPTGRSLLLRLARPVGRRHHATYTRRGKAVQPPPADSAGAEPARDVPPEHAAEDASRGPEPSTDAELKSSADGAAGADEQQQQPTASRHDKAGPIDAILYMREPSLMSPPRMARKQPSGPLTHYFDTYAIVNRLTDAGFQRGQAITTMKAVRALLGDKMGEAQGRLVSRSDVDNESYLFKAACSELSTEVRNNRRAADDAMREQRMRLQHDTDVLWQTLNHELLTLNDTVRGLFDDRKMAVREEQKANAGAIQKINYKIGTMLSSDTKSDIEGLRWVLIRRSALGMAFMAVVSLATLRYAAYVNQQRKEEAERKRKAKAKAKAAEEEERRKDPAEVVMDVAAAAAVISLS
ncbi:uncharacterized protein DNG_05550 [Cephalotrichum gorgonifer]|uniref:DUF1640 domain-containing protein n=1 Tax=Cephalotrichum gorgonifer TaxID=2041049 RepID=A0AAE8MYI4_9PEZI|nr:uncharacterized protein DNG_05550 [Cephalotrichum gorgonifer]